MHSQLLEGLIRWLMMSMVGSAPKIHLYMTLKMKREQRLSTERIIKYIMKRSLKSLTITPRLFQEFNQVLSLKNMRLNVFNKKLEQITLVRRSSIMFSFQKEVTQKISCSIRILQKLSAFLAKHRIFLLFDSRSMFTKQKLSNYSELTLRSNKKLWFKRIQRSFSFKDRRMKR